MSSSWVAASVRAKLLTSRRLGSARARELATSPSIEVAVQRLAASPYGHDVAVGMSLEEAQHAVAATLLWHMRVLAGWLPPGAGDIMRSLAGWFELANVQERLAFFDSGQRRPVFELGSLSTAWPVLSQATSHAELASALSRTAWGGRPDDGIDEILTRMRLRWASRVRDAVPFIAHWVTAALLLFAARLLFVAQRRPSSAAIQTIPGLASRWRSAVSIPELALSAPPGSRWVLEDIRNPDQLWIAERRWWQRVSAEAAAGIVRAVAVPQPVVAATALLAVDAYQTRAALAVCAGGARWLEIFDAVA